MRESDPFDRFFSLWMALVVAAERVTRRDGDREKIRRYFRSNIPQVLDVLEEEEETMRVLAQRTPTDRKSRIVDTENTDLQRKFERLADHYSGNPNLSEEVLVDAVAELLNKIRNNVFHGRKVYDDREDIGLLECVNPLLVGILRKCENL